MSHSDIKPGAKVACAYRGTHTGIVLANDDPRAWAGTLAFPEANPEPAAVREHVLKVASLLDHKRPVLWAFENPRVYWDSQLTHVLDCGHASDWNHGSEATTPAGASLCRACAHRHECDALLGATTGFAYLASDTLSLTDWSGQGPLAQRRGATRVTRGCTPTGGHYETHRFRAVDVHGQHWACQGPGPSMYVRMRRVKAR